VIFFISRGIFLMHEMEWRGKVSTRSLNYSFITIQQLLFFALPFHYPRAQLKFGALQPTPKKTSTQIFHRKLHVPQFSRQTRGI
jgi:hypothetical protein